MINYEAGKAYVALAKNISTVFIMLEKITQTLKNDRYAIDEIFDDLLLISYVSRVGIVELLEKYKWNPNGFLFIDSIDSEAIPLTQALQKTVERVLKLGKEINVEAYTTGIIEKQEMFYNYEQTLPENFKQSLLE